MTTWERLNAYVDGRLAPSEAAHIAALIADDQEAAARVATLSKLKAVTAMTAELETAPPPLLRPPRRLRFRVVALAASLLVGALVTLTWVLLPSPETSAASLQEASAALRTWLNDDKAHPALELARDTLDARVALAAPDLSAAGLSLVHVALVPGTDRNLFLGYRGVHGCRLGIWIGAAAVGLGSRPVAFAAEGLYGFAWRNGGEGYAVLTQGIEKERLSILAEAVARIVEQYHRPSDEIRAALNSASGMAKPCAA